MNFWLLLSLVFFSPLLLFIAWLAFSSCLGDVMRNRRTGSILSPGTGAYGRSYLRSMAGTGPAMSEQIELEDILVGPEHHR